MSRQDIAKILFQFHMEIWKDPEQLERRWKDLPKDSTWANMGQTCKREYLRMTDGVRKKILNELVNVEFKKNEPSQINLP